MFLLEPKYGRRRSVEAGEDEFEALFRLSSGECIYVCVVGLKRATASAGRPPAGGIWDVGDATVAAARVCEDGDGGVGVGVVICDGDLSLIRLSFHCLSAFLKPFLPAVFCIFAVASCVCVCAIALRDVSTSTTLLNLKFA